MSKLLEIPVNRNAAEAYEKKAFSKATVWAMLLARIVLFVLLQAGRVWVIATLGRFWTTRIVTLPGAPLVRRGPFRWVRHPNYLVVAGELAVLPLVFGAWWIAVLATLLNAPLTLHRIRVEDGALSGRRALRSVGNTAS